VNRRDLHDLSRTRLNEAKALLRMKYPDGAYYLAGYAVECALKACIAKTTLRYDFPDKKKVGDSHTHSLENLMKLANLEEARLEQAQKDSVFRTNWDLVKVWSEQSRYGKHDSAKARALVTAVNDRQHGVMVWIRRRW
jgi:HEPN domain-containing protein